MQTKVEIYSDGACKGNPGIGGWGAVLRYGKHEKLIKGAVAQTTNNRMELTAAIEALKQLKRPCEIIFYTDSIYLKNGICEWSPKWLEKGWLQEGSASKIKNQDLWRELINLTKKHQIEWHWLKAHAGHLGNELADSLANQAISELRAGG